MSLLVSLTNIPFFCLGYLLWRGVSMVYYNIQNRGYPHSKWFKIAVLIAWQQNSKHSKMDIPDMYACMLPALYIHTYIRTYLIKSVLYSLSMSCGYTRKYYADIILQERFTTTDLCVWHSKQSYGLEGGMCTNVCTLATRTIWTVLYIAWRYLWHCTKFTSITSLPSSSRLFFPGGQNIIPEIELNWHISKQDLNIIYKHAHVIFPNFVHSTIPYLPLLTIY